MEQTIKVYSTPTCPYCVKAKAYLKEKGAAFEDIDVATNQEAAAEMVKLSGQMGVPVITVGSEVVIGFDKTRLEGLLG